MIRRGRAELVPIEGCIPALQRVETALTGYVKTLREIVPAHNAEARVDIALLETVGGLVSDVRKNVTHILASKDGDSPKPERFREKMVWEAWQPYLQQVANINGAIAQLGRNVSHADRLRVEQPPALKDAMQHAGRWTKELEDRAARYSNGRPRQADNAPRPAAQR